MQQSHIFVVFLFFDLFFGGAFIKLLFCFQLVSSELGIATNLPFLVFLCFNPFFGGASKELLFCFQLVSS